MPEFVKHFIVANPTILMTLLMGLGLIGFLDVVKRVRRYLTDRVGSGDRVSLEGKDQVVVEKIDRLDRRLRHVEELSRFDTLLRGGSPRPDRG